MPVTSAFTHDFALPTLASLAPLAALLTPMPDAVVFSAVGGGTASPLLAETAARAPLLTLLLPPALASPSDLLLMLPSSLLPSAWLRRFFLPKPSGSSRIPSIITSASSQSS